MLDRAARRARRAPYPSTLRASCSAGGRRRAVLLARAARRGLPVAPTYGLTEAASQVATRRPGRAAQARRRRRPLPGTRVRIAARGRRALRAGRAGRDPRRGATVMARLLAAARTRPRGRSAAAGCTPATSAASTPTGDLHVLDRRSDLIVTGGENVYPAEVEAVLASHPQVCEAAVAGVPDAEFGARPAAWIVAEPAIGADALQHFCRARLAGFKVPVAFHFVASRCPATRAANSSATSCRALGTFLKASEATRQERPQATV